MLNEQVKQYIETLVQPRTPLLQEMEHYAAEHRVPIMDLIGIESLLSLLRIQQPKRILEIGAAIGYSALRMAMALPNVEIVTIERDEERYNKAVQFVERSGMKERVTIIFDDALAAAPQIEAHGPYDALFIDAAKGQYQQFFSLYEPMLTDDAVIYTDNVLFKGLVAEETIEEKRIRSLVHKIRTYNEWLMNHETYNTMIVPVGDGLAISKRRGERR